MSRVKRSFEPTYKELKACAYACASFHASCFEPTYKELKVKNPFKSMSGDIGFEPTYKELKGTTRYDNRIRVIMF